MDFLQVWMSDVNVGRYLQVFIVFVLLVFLFVLTKRWLVNYLRRIAEKTPNDVDDLAVSLLSKITLPVFLVIAFYLALWPLDLSVTVRTLLHHMLVIIITINIAMLMQSVIEYGLSKMYRRRMKDEQSVNLVVKSLGGILQWGVWILGFIFVLDNMGVNVTTLVSGIGIGGIAVAIAAQAVLGDAFSAFSIFMDKPFEIGDFIIIDDYMGSVENIGIKTTRVRSLSGELLIFANSDLTKSRIRNYQHLQTRRVVFTVKIQYQTPTEKVRKIPLLIKEIIDQMKDVRLDRVHFQSLGDFSLVYEIVYYVLSADYNLYMDRQQTINIAIMETLEKQAIRLAYPTQTLNLERVSYESSGRLA